MFCTAPPDRDCASRAARPLPRAEKGCELLRPGTTPLVTPGHHLPCNHVLHVTGPCVPGGQGTPTAEHTRQLQNCYRLCLDAAKEHDMKSIAFCCISTGLFGYPQDLAAATALSTVHEWLEEETNRANGPGDDRVCDVPGDGQRHIQGHNGSAKTLRRIVSRWFAPIRAAHTLRACFVPQRERESRVRQPHKIARSRSFCLLIDYIPLVPVPSYVLVPVHHVRSAYCYILVYLLSIFINSIIKSSLSTVDYITVSTFRKK